LILYFDKSLTEIFVASEEGVQRKCDDPLFLIRRSEETAEEW
jgi:hypothetical protein